MHCCMKEKLVRSHDALTLTLNILRKECAITVIIDLAGWLWPQPAHTRTEKRMQKASVKTVTLMSTIDQKDNELESKS